MGFRLTRPGFFLVQIRGKERQLLAFSFKETGLRLILMELREKMPRAQFDIVSLNKGNLELQ